MVFEFTYLYCCTECSAPEENDLSSSVSSIASRSLSQTSSEMWWAPTRSIPPRNASLFILPLFLTNSSHLGQSRLHFLQAHDTFSSPVCFSSQKEKMLKLGIEPKTFALLARRSNQLSYSSTDFQLRQRRKRILLGCHSTRHKLLLQLECCNEGSHRRTDLCTMRDYSNSRKPSCKSAWSGVIVLGFSFSSGDHVRVRAAV